MKLKQAIFESISSLAWWRDMFIIVIGSLCVSAGFVFFINPYNFVPGGVSCCITYSNRYRYVHSAICSTFRFL